MTRAAIYCRVSSEEQAGEGKTSIQTQLDDCRVLATKLGYTIVGEFTDDRRYRVGRKLVEPSGSRADRPQWRKMLTELEQGRADVVLAWHASRLYRGYRPMADFLEVIEANHITVHLAKDSFDPRFAVLQAWLGKEENSARTERMRFGKIGRARKGMSATSTPRCYKPVRDPDTGATLGYELDPAWRSVLDEMARLFLAREPYRAIAQQLGANPHSGKPFNMVSVYKLLHNPFLFGQLEFGRASRKGEQRFTAPRALHPAAWDDATMDHLAAELARRDQLGNHAPRQLVHPFTGILRCGYCARPMTASLAGAARRNPDGRPYRYYYCQHNRLTMQGYYPGPAHPPNGIPEHKLIELVAHEFDGFDAQDADVLLMALATLSPAERGDDSAQRAELAGVERQIMDLEGDLARVRSDRARAGLAGDIAALHSQAELLRAQLARAAPQSPIDVDATRAVILEVLEDPAAFSAPDDQLRRLLNRLFVSLYVKDGELAPKPAV